MPIKFSAIREAYESRAFDYISNAAVFYGDFVDAREGIAPNERPARHDTIAIPIKV